jgi:hypothetical protein
MTLSKYLPRRGKTEGKHLIDVSRALASISTFEAGSKNGYKPTNQDSVEETTGFDNNLRARATSTSRTVNYDYVQLQQRVKSGV